MKRYVILRHDRQGETTHWDLMLEEGEILRTYRIGLPPEEMAEKPVEAERIFDHSLKFLDYEGSVNKGKGTVEVADKGTYEVISENESQLKIRFSGEILKKEIIFATGGGPVRRG
jgi:bifunctional non-homologous end joining protein LigD